MQKILHIGLIALALCAHCEAVISVASPSSEWTPILNDGGSDPAGDNQTGNPGDESDIIGDSANPSFYKFYNGTDFGFRLRLGGQDKSSGYTTAALFGLDVNGDSNLDYYIAANIDGIGNKLDIGIYAFTGPATSPSTSCANRGGVETRRRPLGVSCRATTSSIASRASATTRAQRA